MWTSHVNAPGTERVGLVTTLGGTSFLWSGGGGGSRSGWAVGVGLKEAHDC